MRNTSSNAAGYDHLNPDWETLQDKFSSFNTVFQEKRQGTCVLREVKERGWGDGQNGGQGVGGTVMGIPQREYRHCIVTVLCGDSWERHVGWARRSVQNCPITLLYSPNWCNRVYQLHVSKKKLNKRDERGKSKRHWDTTSRPPGWLQSKRQARTSGGEEVGKLEPSATVGGNVKRHRHFAETASSSSKDVEWRQLPRSVGRSVNCYNYFGKQFRIAG